MDRLFSPEKLYIRADMNETIATGHIMRCLSVADAAQSMGIETVFILADDCAERIISERGFDSIVLGTKWDDLDAEIPVMLDLIRKNMIKHLLVDSYYVTDKYLKELSKVTGVTYLDDLNEKQYPAHSLIAYDACWDEEEYRKKHRDSKVFYGYDYVPLRKEFLAKERKHIPDKAETLLIMSGGADSKHAIKNILSERVITEFEKVFAICGKLNSDFAELSAKYKDSERIEVLSGVGNISEYMKRADIAVSASGNTVYELCALGVPTIAYAMNETQIASGEKMSSVGAIEYVGLVDDPGFWKSLSDNLLKLAGDREKREKLSGTGHRMIDAGGSERIVKVIMDLV